MAAKKDYCKANNNLQNLPGKNQAVRQEIYCKHPPKNAGSCDAIGRSSEFFTRQRQR
ncbi:hypothetical protein [Legionella sp. MW5194]|uniref:hypothetical protein n=1 Tax=Legionella sp. MW5194 TaxID=2662448 RepID=UPI00193E520F|nr:hypothetical protein [Legionella sp. MW5194]